ncbi:MAG: hypothetical protein ABEL04_04645 [Salinibacter sp.]|uniref:hypothetical protein n=1 Tax=Salinibacter sp. TaxID=2065818 RepID=UPI0035D46FB4
MRTILPLLCLVFVLSATAPAHAQLREEVQRDASVVTKLYDTGSAATNALGNLFGAEHFRMGHSYQMSFSSFGGQTASMGMYTTSMMWQFNSKWAARADVSVAHPLTNGTFGNRETRVFLRNAEVAYRPSENVQVRLQVRQSPYGRYASPYGRYRRGAFSSSQAPLFRKN